MEKTFSTKRAGLEEKIPDFKSTLEMCELLVQKKEEEEVLTTHFELTETLYAKAEVPPVEEVYLWLGVRILNPPPTFPLALRVYCHDACGGLGKHDALVSTTRSHRPPLLKTTDRDDEPRASETGPSVSERADHDDGGEHRPDIQLGREEAEGEAAGEGSCGSRGRGG